MRQFARRRGQGAFSLIELLINVAIVSCLVGVAAPIYQDYVVESMMTKAEADVDVIVSAVTRCEALETKVIGTTLDPILGRYLSVVPLDPWGNDYAFDGYICCIGSFGSDSIPFGYDNDDVIRQYNKYLTPIRVQLQGGFGPPRQGVKVIITTSKPFMMIPGYENLVSEEIELILENGDHYPLHELGFRYSAGETSGIACRLALQCNFPATNTLRLAITDSCSINFSPLMFSMTDYAAPGGKYEEVADDFRYGPIPYTGTGGGLPIERIQ